MTMFCVSRSGEFDMIECMAGGSEPPQGHLEFFISFVPPSRHPKHLPDSLLTAQRMSVESILASFLSQNTGDNSAQREEGFDLAYNVIGFCLIVWLVCWFGLSKVSWHNVLEPVTRCHGEGTQRGKLLTSCAWEETRVTLSFFYSMSPMAQLPSPAPHLLKALLSTFTKIQVFQHMGFRETFQVQIAIAFCRHCSEYQYLFTRQYVFSIGPMVVLGPGDQGSRDNP